MRISRGSVRHNLNILGHIRTGEKSDKGYPVSLDYFKATGDYSPLFHKQFGDRPQLLKIKFFTDDDSISCDERYELRVGTKLYAKGDGELFWLWSDKKKSYVEETVSEYPDLMDIILKGAQRYDEKVQWKERLSLRFILPEMSNVFGCWQFDTGGKESSIKQIVSTYDMVKQMAGTVAGITFDLSVKKVTSQKMESKNSYPVVSLIANSGAQDMEELKLIGGNDVKQISSQTN